MPLWEVYVSGAARSSCELDVRTVAGLALRKPLPERVKNQFWRQLDAKPLRSFSTAFPAAWLREPAWFLAAWRRLSERARTRYVDAAPALAGALGRLEAKLETMEPQGQAVQLFLEETKNRAPSREAIDRFSLRMRQFGERLDEWQSLVRVTRWHYDRLLAGIGAVLSQLEAGKDYFFLGAVDTGEVLSEDGSDVYTTLIKSVFRRWFQLHGRGQPTRTVLYGIMTGGLGPDRLAPPLRAAQTRAALSTVRQEARSVGLLESIDEPTLSVTPVVPSSYEADNDADHLFEKLVAETISLEIHRIARPGKRWSEVEADVAATFGIEGSPVKRVPGILEALAPPGFAAPTLASTGRLEDDVMTSLERARWQAPVQQRLAVGAQNQWVRRWPVEVAQMWVRVAVTLP
jgi:hypothetical protein